jgi:NAD(P)-dependent dehydrogenase (short-subunit alcohol dehydrogenase family)
MPRKVVIVGCSRGIGAGIMDWFVSSEEATVVVGIGRKSDGFDALKVKYQNDSRVSFFDADVVKPDDMNAVASALKDCGIIPDLVIANAGVFSPRKPAWEIPVSDLQHAFDVNVVGCHNTMAAFIPLMRDVDGAVLVNVSSGWGLWGEAGCSSYVMSKHALEGLMKCAALDVKDDKLCIVTVRPGMVATDMLATVFNSKQVAAEKGVPVAKFAGQFCEKILKITKADSGTHIDCGYKGE